MRRPAALREEWEMRPWSVVCSLCPLTEQAVKKPALLRFVRHRTAADALEIDPVAVAVLGLRDVVVARDEAVVEPAGFDALRRRDHAHRRTVKRPVLAQP